MKEKSSGKNFKIILIVVVAIVLVAGIGYLMVRQEEIAPGENGEMIENDESEREEEEAITLETIHLFRAGTGGELGVRNEGEALTVFNPGDYLGISGRYEVVEESRITANLLNENQEMKSERILSGFTAHVTDGIGGFSMCCGAVPGRFGDYHIEILADGERIDLLPFNVVE